MKSMLHKLKLGSALGTIVFVAVISSSVDHASAADAAAATTAATNPPPVKHWDSVASADVTLTSGNSKSFLGTVTINSHGKYEQNEYLLNGAGGYGDNTTKDSTGKQIVTKSQDYLKGSAQWNHLFSERFYGGLKLEGLHDDISDIQYRFTVSPLAGYYFVKKPNTSLCGELGPSYVYQKLDDHTDSFAAVRAAERYEYKFKNGARIWESVEWVAQVDKIDNWLLTAEIGVGAPITKALEARLVLQDWYNNQPAAGRLKNDLKLMAGIGYKF